MPSISNMFYHFSAIIVSILITATLTYFVLVSLLNALVEASAMFLVGTTMTGVIVINQIASLIN